MSQWPDLVALGDGVVEVAVEAVVEVAGLNPDNHVAHSVVLSDVNPTKHQNMVFIMVTWNNSRICKALLGTRIYMSSS